MFLSSLTSPKKRAGWPQVHRTHRFWQLDVVGIWNTDFWQWKELLMGAHRYRGENQVRAGESLVFSDSSIRYEWRIVINEKRVSVFSSCLLWIFLLGISLLVWTSVFSYGNHPASVCMGWWTDSFEESCCVLSKEKAQGRLRLWAEQRTHNWKKRIGLTHHNSSAFKRLPQDSASWNSLFLPEWLIPVIFQAST